MPTPQQRAASRRNGQQTRGPITPEGKATVSQNARTHGLLATKLACLPGEDAEALAALSTALVEALAPVGGLEVALVDRLICLVWRLRRVVAIEAREFVDQAEGYGPLTAREKRLAKVGPALPNGYRDIVANLLRYEGALERSMFKILHELERLRALRAGLAVPVPAVADVTLHLAPDDQRRLP
jgi:hypothetical protein